MKLALVEKHVEPIQDTIERILFLLHERFCLWNLPDAELTEVKVQKVMQHCRKLWAPDRTINTSEVFLVLFVLVADLDYEKSSFINSAWNGPILVCRHYQVDAVSCLDDIYEFFFYG